MKKETPKTFSEEEIVTRLKSELPHWQYQAGWITREFKTSGWKSTLMVVNVIGHLAESAWHHPDLAITYAKVKTKLITHSAKGVTEMDFALAKKIGVEGDNATKDQADIKKQQVVGILEKYRDWNDCAWVIETVAENLALKQEIFQYLDQVVPAHIPIGSNSSGFPIMPSATSKRLR